MNDAQLKAARNYEPDAHQANHVRDNNPMQRNRRCITVPGASTLRLFQRLLIQLILLLAVAAAAQAAEPGFARLTIPNGEEKPLEAAVWYPTGATPHEERLGPRSQTVATNAPLEGRNLPLILISHGSGGWYGGHADTAIALAKAGFIVAAVTHRGDSLDDQSRIAEIWIRPAQLKRLTDYMLTAWPQREAIDASRVGVFGFSAGAFTALVAAGGTPDLTRVGPFCETHAQEDMCRIVSSQKDVGEKAASLTPSSWVHDDRIRAAVVAAPAVGFSFAPHGLDDVHIPVQLWRAEFDHVLPSPDYAEPVRDALPTPPEYHVVANADHYDFLPPCSPTQRAHVPFLCTSRPGFDRAAFHAQFNTAVVAFFEKTLGEQ